MDYFLNLGSKVPKQPYLCEKWMARDGEDSRYGGHRDSGIVPRRYDTEANLYR